MESGKKYPGGFTETDFFNWITWDEAKRQEIDTEYTNCDKYVENNQAPDNVPSDLTFIEENLCLDLVSGYTGQICGGKFNIKYNNAEGMGEVLNSVVSDIIFRANKFNERLFEQIAWRFYKNGIAGISIQFNPFKKTIYGIGVPEIYVLRWQDILLDANSRGNMHDDDNRRGLSKRVRIDYAKRRYPKFADKIKPSKDEYATNETDQYCNIYNYEYKVTELSTDEMGNQIEEDVYYMFKTINDDILAEEPVRTGFSQFMLVIPCIHTGREAVVSWPMGAVLPVIQTQNEINSVKSVMLEQIKHSIKNLLVIMNAKAADEAKIRLEAAKPNGIVVLEGQNVQIQTPYQNQIAVALIQWYEFLRKAFDEVTGRYAPERGATDGDLSGKAIALLQNRGAVPEQVRKSHIELALSEMASGILECVGKKMYAQPFKVEHEVDGQKMDVYFNYPVSQIPIEIDFDSPFVNATENETGNPIINDLRKVDIDKIDLNVEVQMDVIGNEINEANKALIARQQGGLSLKDFVKKMYPTEWRMIYENKLKEDEILGMMNELMEIGKQAPEEYGGLMEQMMGVVQQGKQLLQMGKGESNKGNQ